MEITQKLKSYFDKNRTFLINVLIIEVISHVFYKVSFENFLLRDFEINKRVYFEDLEFYRTELESPFNTILVNLFQIQDPDVYTLVLYIIFQISLVLICKNLSFLEEYSTIFLLGGWLVTVSWWIGFVENISVLLMSVNKTKFRKPVTPGDVLQHKVIKKNNVKNIWKFSCKTYVDSNLVAESELAAILSDNDSINNS